MKTALLGLCLASFLQAGPPSPLPSLDGWTRGASIAFPGDNLYGHIDGGAELFLELGFDRLDLARYQKGGQELTLELYRMESPESALAIYLHKCGTETPLKGIAARHTGSAYQVTALKGRVFLEAHNPKGSPAALPDLVALASAALAAIPDEKPADLLGALPRENRVTGTELLHRGEVSLQSIVTFGDGDLLDLGRKVWAVSADYRNAWGQPTTLIRVDYPSEAAAGAAFRHLSTGLDTTYTVQERSADRLRFTDHGGKRGQAVLAGRRLEITLGLAEVRKP